MQIAFETEREWESRNLESAHRHHPEPVPKTVHPVFSLQRQAGNQAVQHLLRSGVIQTKLTISSPGDPLEREADQVADRIMRTHSGTTPCTCAGEMCEECEQKHLHTESIHRLPSGESVSDVASEVESAIEQERGGGHPLTGAVQRQMESVFGADFSSVRVHTDSRANMLNRAVSAIAFTTGNDIFFRQGAYDPSSSGGKQLLAHELTHVVQQNGIMRGDPASKPHAAPAGLAREPDAGSTPSGWTPPAATVFPSESMDPRVLKAPKTYQGNPPPPNGWMYWPNSKKVTPAAKRLADLGPKKEPGTFIQDMVGGELIGMRSEWHNYTVLFDKETKKPYQKPGLYHGGSLMVPIVRPSATVGEIQRKEIRGPLAHVVVQPRREPNEGAA